jgi:heme exporter protein A
MHSPQQLSTHALACERNNELLFSDLHCTLQSGELLQIRGANGSGKSTLLRMLAGFIEPEVGTITWQKKSIFAQRESYQQQLHYLGHQNALKPALTAIENLQFSSALLQQSVELDDIQDTLEKMQLQNLQHTQAQYFSAGQLRRLSLARLLLQPKHLWILDEPTTALDQAGQELLTQLLDQHLTCGGLAIVATHQTLSITQPVKTMTLGVTHA